MTRVEQVTKAVADLGPGAETKAVHKLCPDLSLSSVYQYLSVAVRQGKIKRIEKGKYSLAEAAGNPAPVSIPPSVPSLSSTEIGNAILDLIESQKKEIAKLELDLIEALDDVRHCQTERNALQESLNQLKMSQRTIPMKQLFNGKTGS